MFSAETIPYRAPLRSPRTRTLAALVLGIAAGCSTGNSSATGPTGGGGGGGGGSTGSLAVTITTPSGITPAVTVVGPNGYSKTIAATTTLTALSAGPYSVLAGAAMGPDPIVGIPYAGAVTGSPVTVAAGAAAKASVTYTQRASEGLLLVATANPRVSAFTSAQLAASGAPAPTVSLTGHRTTALAVDAAGGVWTCYAAGDTLFYFTQAQVLTGGAETPTVEIRTPGGYSSDLAGLALDASGDLWVTDRTLNQIYEYTPDQLTTSGMQTPAVTLESALGSLNAPWGLAFDPSGDLWVVDQKDSTIVEYSPSSLKKGGPQVPIGGIMPEGGFGQAVAFDTAGDLWAGGLDGTVSKYTPSQLTTVGSPTAAVAITIGPHAIPAAIAFDASGDMWVADEAAGKVYMYTPQQIQATGAPTPTTTLTNNSQSLGLPTGLAFSPHAATLPLH